MLFNSFAFAVFLPLVFILYWAFFSKSITKRNCFLLACSYVFYGWWDWRFLSLIIISSFTDFYIGKKIVALNEQGEDETSTVRRMKKRWLMVSIITNIGFLGFFKYFNFFADSLAVMLSAVGISLSSATLNIILPVGISFYTFQTLSYTIDLYKRQAVPAKDWVQFFAFVSFFPQLVAGPIERAKNFLPQFERLHTPDYAVFRNAMLLIAWGFFKKIMIADRLAVYVDAVFKNIPAASGMPLVMGVAFFAFQLYLDFSAYSDIAIGTARLFGFDLRKNFNRPYLSVSFGNFWKRWHISLSSWFRDYLYIPLGGNRKGAARTKINTLVVFAVSGLWHGASWNFVIWGTLNALFLFLLDPVLSATKSKNAVVHGLKSLFIWTCWALSLIFFRAQGFQAALDCFANLGFDHTGNLLKFGLNVTELKLTFGLIGVLLLKEIICEWKDGWLQNRFFKLPALVRWAFYIAFVLSMVYLGQYGNGNENSFIYFQF
ncbi:MAG: MBOAT family protein [Bacteroidales bacterium]|jgi:D-alanyl-lipoteichoic acid acyltransferase DltB (MBOAT superfamily)|nr:MBOAT family protein [Bacteroidales bacterium]